MYYLHCDWMEKRVDKFDWYGNRNKPFIEKKHRKWERFVLFV